MKWRIVFVAVLVGIWGLLLYGWMRPCTLPGFLLSRISGIAIGQHYLQQLHLFRVEDPESKYPDEWQDILYSYYVMVPDYELVLFTTWEGNMERDQMLQNLQRAQDRLSDSSIPVELPRFLLLQLGSGVFGLSRQVFLTENGEMMVWNIPDFYRDVEFPDPTYQTVDYNKVLELMDLAEKQDFPEDQVRVEYSCHVIDGWVEGLSYYDGEKVGSVHYINLREPEGHYAEIVSELKTLAGPVGDHRN